MTSDNQIIKTAPFAELVAVPTAAVKNPLFDIIIDEKITLQNYCEALINKLFSIRQSNFPAFLTYQLDQVKDKNVWLNKLEKLVANNETYFTTHTKLSIYNKLYTLKEKKRTELQNISKEMAVKTPKKYINAESEDRYFSFFEVKKQLENHKTDQDKILFLTKEKFEYQQANIEFINQKIPLFDSQCEKEIEQIYALEKLKKEMNLENLKTQKTFKIQINGPINILTDAYKQMMTTVKPGGKIYIQNKIKEVAEFICVNYLDENGQPLSLDTIKTYLSPNRTDKDPNNNTKIRF